MNSASTSSRPTIRLQSGEHVIREGTPLTRMKWSSMVAKSVILLIGVVTAPFVLLVPWLVHRWLGWHRWWLTNERLVVRTGLFGWKLQSVPLDRIVDVTISSSWWDRLWGLEHIKVRDMTGEVGTSGISPNLRLLAVPDAHEFADLLLSSAPRREGGEGEMGEVIELLRVLVSKAG